MFNLLSFLMECKNAALCSIKSIFFVTLVKNFHIKCHPYLLVSPLFLQKYHIKTIQKLTDDSCRLNYNKCFWQYQSQLNLYIHCRKTYNMVIFSTTKPNSYSLVRYTHSYRLLYKLEIQLLIISREGCIIQSLFKTLKCRWQFRVMIIVQ